MPIGTRPNKTYEYVLESDRELPEDKQPVFICTHWNLDDSKPAVDLLDKMSKCANDDIKVLIDISVNLMAMGIVGWKNMDCEFPQNVNKLKIMLRQLMSFEEATELAGIIGEHVFTSGDKKKSESPSPSDTEHSAKTAKDEKPVNKNQVP